MATDLTAAQALIDASLTSDEQAQWHEGQAKQHAVTLLAHVANVERLEGESKKLSGDAKKQVDDAIAQNVAAVEVLERTVTASKGKADTLRAAMEKTG